MASNTIVNILTQLYSSHIQMYLYIQMQKSTKNELL